MSFLAVLGESEHALSLEATLAFIEEFDDASDHSASSSPLPDLDAACFRVETRRDPLLSQRLREPRSSQLQSRRTNAESENPSRVKNKEKILQLRDEVEELQARVSQLQKRAGNRRDEASEPHPAPLAAVATEGSLVVSVQPQRKKPRTSHGGVPSLWLDTAVDQYKKLQTSEKLNRKLRNAAAKQVELSKMLAAHFQKKTSLQAFDFITKMETLNAINQCVVENRAVLPSATPDDLCDQLQRLYLETDIRCSEIALSNEIDSAFSGSHTKYDSVCGPVFELKTNTPASFNFRHLGHTVWSRMAEHRGEAASGIPLDIRPDGVHEQRRHMRLRTPMVGDVDVVATSMVCKFEEPHRIVFTSSSVAVVVGYDLAFREEGWMILTDTSTSLSSPPSALFQTFFRLHASEEEDTRIDQPAERTPPFLSKTGTEQRDQLREFVRKSLSNKVRVHQQQIQNVFLAEGGAFVNAGDALPKTCPFAAVRAPR